MSLPKLASAIFAATLVLSPCLASMCQADTIVLTNGRRIVVSNAVREGGKVSGDTPSGRLSLPESMVASIETERGPLGARSTSAQAPDLSIGPPRQVPQADSDPAVIAVVRNGAIDQEALARLDSEADGGNADAIARAVAGESAASQFEFGRGNFEQALAHAERGLTLAPDQVTLLINAAYLHLRQSEYSAAADLLDRARRLAPDSPDVAKLDGWADYGLNKLPDAVAEWQRALQLRPGDQDVANALKKAEQDAKIEANFEEGYSAHFVLHYDGGAAPDLARAVLGALESDFGPMVSLLDYTPAEPIAVVLYTDKDFEDITQAPAWVGALNDGRIRIPVQGLLTVTPELAHVLRHELAHSFVSQKTRGNCPVWLQEGIAQWAEGKTAAGDAPLLTDLYNRHDDPSLSALEKSWLALPPDFARVAYAWSLATVEAIVQSGTPVDIDRLLDALSAGSSIEGALRTALQTNYADLNRSTADYLSRTYLH
jgi:tetratricopeptide (TPR) repeat protein